MKLEEEKHLFPVDNVQFNKWKDNHQHSLFSWWDWGAQAAPKAEAAHFGTQPSSVTRPPRIPCTSPPAPQRQASTRLPFKIYIFTQEK